METDAKPQDQEAAAFQQALNDNGAVDSTQRDLDTPPQPVAPPLPANMREIVLRVPKDVTDQMANAAWQTGMNAVFGVMNNVGTIIVPADVPGPDGKPMRSIGQQQILLRNSNDVKIICELGALITKCNQHVIEETKKGTAEKIAATLETKNIKEEGSRQATALVKGEKTIIAHSGGMDGAAMRQPAPEKKTDSGIIITE